MKAIVAMMAAGLLAACASTAPQVERATPPALALNPGETPEVRALVNEWADRYDVPRTLVHRVIQRESDYRPGARNGPYWGMMQILPATARSMGFDGEPTQLLSPETALKYSIRYLRGAWMLADGDEQAAMMWYARGYYYEAKARGLLTETGLRGPLWDEVDAGKRALPPLAPDGAILTAAPTCAPREGLARVVAGTGCPAG
jgi:soluble lytic murein transglycosylase-like protein